MKTGHPIETQSATPEQLEVVLHTLAGALQGVCIDGVVNELEWRYLEDWTEKLQHKDQLHPFRELSPILVDACTHRRLTHQNLLDILWLCEQMSDPQFTTQVHHDLRMLEGILAGISADLQINKLEINGLQGWLRDHNHLHNCWPYDRVDCIVERALLDGQLDTDEHKFLLDCFSQIAVNSSLTGNPPEKSHSSLVDDVCAKSPVIIIADRTFCFTGHGHSHSDQRLAKQVSDRKGIVVNAVVDKLDYLVVCADRNMGWQYHCFGRKIGAAIDMQQRNLPVLIVHESDLQAVIDNS